MKRALITGITGQDGSYLAKLLLSKGYEVHGIIRRASTFNTSRIDHIFDRLHLYHGDMTDGASLRHVIALSKPDEIYNLAAQSHVKVSFDCAEYTTDVIVMGTLRLLEAIRDLSEPPRLYQASSSEMYGNVESITGGDVQIDEDTPFHPVSPYGIAKLAAHNLCVMYREVYGLFISCGILFNHESPRRGETFVTRKICKAVARIEAGLQNELELGNLLARRDWGYAPDYVEAMWMMLQSKPDDFVIATSETHQVKDLCCYAFNSLGLDWHQYVKVVSRLKRPLDIDCLCGNSRKAKEVLGWKLSVTFEKMLDIMIQAEREALK